MPKTAYPTTVDLADYLAGTGLFRAQKVTVGVVSSTTHNVQNTTVFRVGWSLFFQNALELRAITAIPGPTSVTVSGTAFTSTMGENVYLFPAGLDFTSAAAAGVQIFERETGRKMLATADQARNFDLPTTSYGMLDLRADLAAITSVSIDGTNQVLYTDFRPLSEDADEESLPWARIQFARKWLVPNVWPNVRVIQVIGRWGYASSTVGMPEDAWNAMLAAAFRLRIPQLAALRTRGIVSYGEADVNENYGQRPLGGLDELWAVQFKEAVARYRRVTVY